ncbi:unnamed protein product [Heligmosomoides polygyrus]|uniref:Nuclease HARBI1 n=1 Tax=Heligmosomoides polygyrus TaxID=6339 RepID=A0A183F6B2_HELPZ|nr:unnamed protein product [Heligmosomoides polygyrus]
MDVVATLNIAKKYGSILHLFRDRTCPYDLSDVSSAKTIASYAQSSVKSARWYLERCYGRGVDMTVAHQLALRIHLLGRNVMQSDAARIAGCHQAIVSRVLALFVKAVVNRAGQQITWPNSEDCKEIRRAFFMKCRIPGIVVIIGGTHCRIQRPSSSEEDFVFRKGYHSINAGIVWTLKERQGGFRRSGKGPRWLTIPASSRRRSCDSAYGSEEFLLKLLNIMRTAQGIIKIANNNSSFEG